MLAAISELQKGLIDWRRWAWLGVYDIRLQNRRSFIGMWWPALSTAIFVFGVGHLFALLMDRPLDIFLPHIVIGWLTWQLIIGAVVQGSGVFISGRIVLLEAVLPANTLVLRLLVRLTVQFLMSLVVVAAVFLYLGKPIPLMALTTVPALLLNLAILHGVVLFLGILCAWMRDLEKLIEAGMRLAFFLTPIIWMADSNRFGAAFIINYNPFYYMIEVFRAPVIDGVFPVHAWWIIAGLAVASNLAAMAAFAFARRRIIYWL